MNKKDTVVYTGISNWYDDLHSPLPLWREEAQFVAFLDPPQTSSEWEVRPIYRRFRDPCRNAKIHKVLAHKYFPEAEYSLWADGSVKIISVLPLNYWLTTFLKHNDLAIYRHRLRNCAYREAIGCIEGNLDSPDIINRQMRKYFSEGYPIGNGLAECTVIFRRHTKAISQFNEAWYKEIKTGSRRDQLSFNYVAHKLGVKINYLPGSLWNNPHFEWTGKHKIPRHAPK